MILFKKMGLGLFNALIVFSPIAEAADIVFSPIKLLIWLSSHRFFVLLKSSVHTYRRLYIKGSTYKNYGFRWSNYDLMGPGNFELFMDRLKRVDTIGVYLLYSMRQ